MSGNENLSLILRRRRKALGLSLERVAARAGTSTATLSRYENGWTRFEVGTLRKLASALNCRLRIDLDALPPPLKPDDAGPMGRLFWDKPFEPAFVDKYPRWVVARVVEYGDVADIHALVKHFGVERFLGFVARVPYTSKRIRLFWERMLEMEGVPCMKKRFPQEAGDSFLP